MIKMGWNRLDFTVENDETMFVRTGSFLQHPPSSLYVPRKLTMPFSRLSKQIYFLFKVTGCSFTLTTPYEDACISEIDVPEGDALIIKMDHILAFSADVFMHRVWHFDLVSLLTWQFRYIYLPGPVRVAYFGLGQLTQEHLENESRDYDQGAVIGWTNGLAQGISTRSSFLSALFAKEEICLDRFQGTGTLLTQASTIKKLPKRFHAEGNNSWVDYLNAVLGLRI